MARTDEQNMCTENQIRIGPWVGGPQSQQPIVIFAIATVMTGVFITAVDTTIVVLGLPAMNRELNASLADTLWVIIAYVLVITLLATPAGRIADNISKVSVFRIGFLVFLVGSVLTAFAWNAGAAIAFRVVQACGAACITATSGAIASSMVPAEKRGGVYGLIGVSWSLGAIVGIVAGGVIVSMTSWRFLFAVNVPICLGVLVFMGRTLKNIREQGPTRRRSIDVVGMVTLGAMLLSVLWTVTQIAIGHGGNPWLLLLSPVFLGLFLVNEHFHKDPMVNLAIFRIPTMTGSLFAALFQGLGNFAVLFLALMYLQGPVGVSPVTASLLLVPGYVLGGLLCPLGGYLADRWGAVWPATLGLAAEVLALFLYAQTGIGTSVRLVVAASLVNGLGTGLFIPSNNSAVMKAAPPAMLGTCSGMLRTCANIGMVCSFSFALFAAARALPSEVVLAIFSGSFSIEGAPATAFVPALHQAFYSLMVVMGVSAAFSVSRGRRRDSSVV